VKHSFFILVFFVYVTTSAQDVKTSVSVSYFGKNVFIENPDAKCVSKVLANGSSTTELNVKIIEVKLKDMNLADGTSVTLEIWHKPGCTPKIVSGNSAPKNAIEFVSVAVDNGVLTWKTKNEGWKFYYIVEEFRWNKCIKLGEVEAKGGSAEQTYTYALNPHSGVNKVRLKYYDLKAKVNYSKAVEFNPSISEVTITTPIKDLKTGKMNVKTQIVFSAETVYEIFDKYGTVVKQGIGKTINCTDLKKGTYYLNYDNTMAEINKI